MTGTNCDLFTHKSSWSYLIHLVYMHFVGHRLLETHDLIGICGLSIQLVGSEKYVCKYSVSA
jgi:hypothetical protein